MAESSANIEEHLGRLETIAETLEDGEIDLVTAKELREEADEHLKKLRDQLDVGDGEIIDVTADE